MQAQEYCKHAVKHIHNYSAVRNARARMCASFSVPDSNWAGVNLRWSGELERAGEGKWGCIRVREGGLGDGPGLGGRKDKVR